MFSLSDIQFLYAQLRAFLVWLPDWAASLILLALAVVLALAAFSLLVRVVRRMSMARDRHPHLLTVFRRVRAPARLAIILLALVIAIPAARLSPQMAQALRLVLLLATIALIGWGAIVITHTAADLYLRRFRLDVEDNLMARKHVTQIRVLLRTADTLIVLVTIGAALMTFESVRQYGLSLFASAGAAGLVLGFAARPVLTNLFAGVQLAITQPIRLEDIVVVEGENGTVEEIGSTYVVIRIWDWRRMIVPLSYFIEKPFQNLTRQSGAILGTVMLYLDYRTPVDVIRQKADEIVKQSPLWSGGVFAVHVTDAKEDAIEVRILVSAARSSASFDLRCELREKLIAFIASELPHALPQRRTISDTSGGRGRDAAITQTADEAGAPPA